MTQPRYFPRYHGKDGFEERYVVADRTTGEALSPPQPHDSVKRQCDQRNLMAVEGGGAFPGLSSLLVAACAGSLNG